MSGQTTQCFLPGETFNCLSAPEQNARGATANDELTTVAGMLYRHARMLA
jgi:hypothetical protein